MTTQKGKVQAKTAAQKQAAPAQEVEVAKVQEDVVVEAKPEVKASAPAVKKQIDKTQEVECRSVVSNPLIYVSKRTHMTVEWDGYGDVQWIPVEELITMKSQQPKFLNRPWIIIDDESVVEFLGLKKVYEGILPIDNIEEFILYSQLDELEATLSKSPKGIRTLVSDKARELVQNGGLYDIRIMRLLDRVLNIDLTMIQE